MSEVRAAINALKAGRPVRVGTLAITSVETGADGGGELLISGERAAALGLAQAREAADPHRPVLIERSPWLDEAAVRRLVDPSLDFSRGPAGPLQPLPLRTPTDSFAAVVLTRLAGLLPALWVGGERQPDVEIAAGLVLAARRRTAVTLAARARLPIDGIDADTQIAVFRAAEDGSEHPAVVIGAPAGSAPLVRLHSECLTGDVFGSLKCDCGPQLHAALKLIAAEGAGVLLYLRDEGRGIGLANKIRAYQLQDRGLDTVEANQRLGFADDERDYALAAAMLRALGLHEVRLLTNNPGKVRGLEDAGIRVVERVAHHMPANPHNADYLATKRAKSGHLA
ncbi:GTP cyclohydrolase II [Sphingomonas sp. BN140010]|uniref:GTP cyclohydrolase-2 n=1 Tax=Sphingomonas arvum TaxID=2992113 RepID=A0ABT3JFJ8_9SPHN|nr:GTP cyclohydrolase II [Sphingomonas sp. BN140010]MCW3797719.1 GTP cyclohydrolase II [Sphingomonas sp. BN140010]